MVPDDVGQYGGDVVERLASVFDSGLLGAYFVGSVALGGFVAGESDIDIVAVCRRRLDDAAKHMVVDALDAVVGFCPARGLELTLYRSDVLSAAPRGADFEVNVSGGPRMARSVHLLAETEPAFWYVLDRWIARRHGVVISGPPPAALFADVDRPVVLRSMAESMRWHREHEGATLYSVLNAARAWRFAVDDEFGSKLDGASWARARWHQPWVIDAAVELRHGRPARLGPGEVDELLEHVQRILETSHRP